MTLDELVSPVRTARVTWPRQVAMYLARELTEASLPAIGREFGGRNHATVLHAWRRTSARMAEDREAYDAVHRVCEQLGERSVTSARVRQADPRLLTDSMGLSARTFRPLRRLSTHQQAL